MSLTPNQKRLLRFVIDHTGPGVWTHLGEDARPDALLLAEDGLVEVNEAEDKYRLPGLKKTMKAFPYDAEDPLGGDHEFYAPDDAIEYNEGDTFETLVERKNSERFKEYIDALASGEISQEEYDEEVEFAEEIAGFWLVEEDKLELAALVWPNGGCGTDSATYQCNHSAKRIIRDSAVADITDAGITYRG